MGATYGSARVSCAFYNTKARLGISFPSEKRRFRVILGRETIWLWSLKLLTGRDRQVAWMHFFIFVGQDSLPNVLRVSECLK